MSRVTRSTSEDLSSLPQSVNNCPPFFSICFAIDRRSSTETVALKPGNSLFKFIKESGIFCKVMTYLLEVVPCDLTILLNRKESKDPKQIQWSCEHKAGTNHCHMG